MRKKIIIWTGSVLMLAFIIWIAIPKNKVIDQVFTSPVRGDFLVSVVVTGELEAKSAEEINGPTGLRTIGLWSEIKILDMVAEGTLVDSGDFVASLDKTEISSKIKDLESEIEKLQTQLTKTRLDTTLDLRNARDELVNLRYSYEEQQINLDQSKYEAPATQRQAQIELEKRERTYKQTVNNYKLKTKQAEASMQDVEVSLTQSNRKRNQMIEILAMYTVYAPKSGMIIYKRSWRGRKLGIGSTISPWNNVVARLPNLQEMVSKTYVSEIDVRKLNLGQDVEIGVDAFPEKKFTGMVSEIANIGEQLNNSDAKVFEVVVLVNEFDSILRPSMTTKNTIITSSIPDKLFVPLECVHTEDSLTFAYLQKGNRVFKQEIMTGESNDNEIIVHFGLDEKDKLLMNIPEDHENLKILSLEVSEEELKVLEEEKAKRMEESRKKADEVAKKMNEKGKRNKAIPSNGSTIFIMQ